MMTDKVMPDFMDEKTADDLKADVTRYLGHIFTKVYVKKEFKVNNTVGFHVFGYTPVKMNKNRFTEIIQFSEQYHNLDFLLINGNLVKFI